MPAVVLDGTIFASQIKAEVAEEVSKLAASGVRPGLAAILVGNDPASQSYVRSKVRTCEELGIHSELITPSLKIETDELIALIAKLNRRATIDGILVQLPLPEQIDAKRVLASVAPEKDVDGFHPVNIGNLSSQRPGLVPCTPAGCMEILRRAEIPVEGQEAVIVGRSDIVGKPMAMLPLPHAQSCRGLPARRHPGRSDRTSRLHHHRIHQARRHHPRRWHQPHHRSDYL
jgi:methylenetetrahydrofolate dehydrogenase (NADP+)/methenyltetrahydrofolate cyclohydrolase